MKLKLPTHGRQHWEKSRIQILGHLNSALLSNKLSLGKMVFSICAFPRDLEEMVEHLLFIIRQRKGTSSLTNWAALPNRDGAEGKEARRALPLFSVT